MAKGTDCVNCSALNLTSKAPLTMCGIAGYLGDASADELNALAHGMSAALEHRGPDSRGWHVAENIMLTHTRLSIIDLGEGGAQPAYSEDRRHVLVYNGELYNYRELKTQLQQLGVHFRTSSDTEVVLQALRHWGEAALPRFNGMFALALWDAQTRVLLLARDRFGQKPLYYAKIGDSLLFASEIKALRCHPQWSDSLSPQGLIEYLFFGNAQGSHTLHAHCHKLAAGEILRLGADLPMHVECWWGLEDVERHQPDRADAIVEIRDLLSGAVRRHLQADVPVGLFLSGGLDSASICHFAAEALDHPLSTWSVEFEGQSASSELALAREVAQAHGTEHNELTISWRDLSALLERMCDVHDQPFGDAANLPLYLMSEALEGQLRVVLQGDGGDEMFGGYRRYALLRRLSPWRLLYPIAPLLRRLPYSSASLQRILRMIEALGSPFGDERSARLLTEEAPPASVFMLFRPEHRHRMLAHDPFLRYRELWPQVRDLDAVQAMLWLDSRILLPDLFLEKVDRATMAQSVEVRVPFLDTQLSDYLMGMPANFKSGAPGKPLLREIMRGRLPESVLSGRKLGFGVPYSEWLRGPLAGELESRLMRKDGLVHELFDNERLQLMCRQHRSGQGRHAHLLYKLLMLATWSDSKPGMTMA